MPILEVLVRSALEPVPLADPDLYVVWEAEEARRADGL